jgi:glycosyltransferase involved in cell wall biosynthesis
VTVVCLSEGVYDLPKNVEVLSLGKERNVSKLSYILNFYKFLILKHADYDRVFVHMNQEYMLLGGLIWRLFNRGSIMWRNHPSGGLLTRLAVCMANGVMCTSKDSYTAKFKKTVIMPVGVDTNIFSPITEKREANSLLLLGRIAPIKNVHLFIEALVALANTGVSFHADIYGNPGVNDQEYYKTVRANSRSLEDKGLLTFFPGIPNNATPFVYGKHDIFVNATPSGAFDKTIIEAMACGCIVLTSNSSLHDVLPNTFLFKEGDVSDLAQKLNNALSLADDKKESVREYNRTTAKNHDITFLMKKIVTIASSL